MVENLGLSFHNIRALHKKLDAMPEKAGEWKTTKLNFKERPKEIFTVRHRDPVEAIRSLWKDPQLSPQMVFAPKKVYSKEDSTNRIFTEMWTGNWWPAIQVNLLLSIYHYLLSYRIP